MKLTAYLFALLVLTFGFVECRAQAKPQPLKTAAAGYKSSAAFAELRIRQAELEADVESLLEEYTEEYPKVKEIRSVLTFLRIETDRLANAAPGSQERLSAALGKLMVKKAEMQAELVRLLETLQPAHPDVKRAKRKLDIFEAAIKEILG
ncbi:MAG: hypothetical protein IT173_17045 [Acidobacteria bacterium]|nr:hypothetical protein [Acidobacteriota bacterium]